MSSWPHARSRSRTSHRPRHQQAARLSRPSTTTQQPTHGTPSVPRGITGPHRPEPPAPERHVLTIINFQSFADLSSRREFTPDNVDFLDAECRLHLDAIEEISHPRGPFVPKKDGQMQFAQKAVKKHCGREKDLTAKTNWP